MLRSNRARLAGLLSAVSLVLALTLGACGGDDGGPTDVTSDTTFTVSLDGGATLIATSVNISVFTGRVFIIGSAGPNQSAGLGFELRTGTQVTSTAGGATASLALIGQGSWAAGPNLSASSGSIVLTTATANHVVGTFNFTLVATAASTPPTRQFSGRIDIRY